MSEMNTIIEKHRKERESYEKLLEKRLAELDEERTQILAELRRTNGKHDTGDRRIRNYGTKAFLYFRRGLRQRAKTASRRHFR